uniref:RNase H type-1 domain-containing protein n=1 Tax=Quercus lobata TaxID=97700 RepID=A0A7N2LS86_QUELO
MTMQEDVVIWPTEKSGAYSIKTVTNFSVNWMIGKGHRVQVMKRQKSSRHEYGSWILRARSKPSCGMLHLRHYQQKQMSINARSWIILRVVSAPRLKRTPSMLFGTVKLSIVFGTDPLIGFVESFHTLPPFLTCRNKFRCNKPSFPPQKGFEHASALLSEFQLRATNRPQQPKPLRTLWAPPDINSLKINYDGAVFTETLEARIGVVIRSSSGTMLVALSEKIPMPSSMEVVEILAARTAAQFTAELGLDQAIFEGDPEVVFKALSDGLDALSPLGHLIKDFKPIAGSVRVYSFSHEVGQFCCPFYSKET